jgi:hypothetical protein
MVDSLDTAKAAADIGTDARTLRKFLRSNASPLQPVGQGARYVITPTDIPVLKEKFESWRGGKRAKVNSSSTAPRSSGQKRGRSKATDKVDPLEGDDLIVRLTSTIAQRQRAHGVICRHSWPHPKVKGLTVNCTAPTVADSVFCKHHTQLTWCGSDEPDPAICGPSPKMINMPTGHPHCKYHAGDISEEDFNQLLLDNPDAGMLP